MNLNKPTLYSILKANGLSDRISDTVHSSAQPFSGSRLLAKARNTIVHHSTTGYPNASRLVRAWKTCLYFLELLILRKLGHDGAFCDRFHAESAGTRSSMPYTATA